MNFNDTSLIKHNTILRLLCSALITLLVVSFPVECPQFLRLLSRVPLSHLAGILIQSSLPVVKSLSGPLSHLACHLFQPSLPVVKSLRGPRSHLACQLSQSSLTVVRWCHKLSENSFNAPISGTCSVLLV